MRTSATLKIGGARLSSLMAYELIEINDITSHNMSRGAQCTQNRDLN